MDIAQFSQTETYFAPAMRFSRQVLLAQRQEVLRYDLLDALIQAMPGYALLLNRQRQVVAVNRPLLELCGNSADDLLGMRPGEILSCIHLQQAPGGCGTSRECSICGAVLAIVESQTSDKQVIRECRITVQGAHVSSLDMQAVATPVTIGEGRYTVLALRDISSEKRLEVLERVFFHDVINTAGGIHGLSSMLAEHDNLSDQAVKEYKKWLVDLSYNLLEEIRSHRNLMAAERGQFVPKATSCSIRSILEGVCQLYCCHDKTPGRILNLAAGEDCDIVTDPSVLRRIIGNMVLNALEASPPGATITMSSYSDATSLTVDVHNTGVMPEEIQLQIFNRSFSTKSTVGRGIGTYSMKLFGEQYLHGRVFFRSNSEEGTTFSITLPFQ